MIWVHRYQRSHLPIENDSFTVKKINSTRNSSFTSNNLFITYIRSFARTNKTISNIQILLYRRQIYLTNINNAFS